MWADPRFLGLIAREPFVVQAYYKLAALEEMPEGTYRRAVELLQRKRTTQARREATHAQN
jgi:hypothetical protein